MVKTALTLSYFNNKWLWTRTRLLDQILDCHQGEEYLEKDRDGKL